jgi:VanZ family protein
MDRPPRTALTSRLLALRPLWITGVAVWLAVLWLLSAQSDLPAGPSIPGKDKIEHCLYFCAGGIFFLLALYGRSPVIPDWRALSLRGMAFTGLVGALDEFHQTFTPGRSGNDPWDWLADLSGGALAGWLLWNVLRRAGAV